MATVWELEIGGRTYEVRSAGKSLRLYTDGVFHTQYNPERLLTGGVWDLLALPALMHPLGSIRRVLLLGVGGGAAIHLLRALVQPERIVGVELDPIHVKVMERFFRVRGDDVEIITGDAVDFMEDYQGEGFDLIVDDLFYEEGGEPHRAVEADRTWKKMLRDHLNPGGMLVMNFVSRAEFRAAQEVNLAWRSVFALTLAGYENCIGVFSRRECEPTDMDRRLMALSESDGRLDLERLRYRIRRA